MKKLLIVFLLLLITTLVFGQFRTASVDEYTGKHWNVLSNLEKTSIVDGFLSGFSMWRDYIFDLDMEIYDRYEAYDEFLTKENIVEKVIQDLDRYYKINENNYKYDDRVINMIIVFYGKYWWR